MLILAVTVVAYGVGCFYYFNHGSDRLATLYFGYAVLAAVLARFLLVRLDSHGGRFSGLSLLLFVVGLLPLLAVALGVGKVGA